MKTFLYESDAVQLFADGFVYADQISVFKQDLTKLKLPAFNVPKGLIRKSYNGETCEVTDETGTHIVDGAWEHGDAYLDRVADLVALQEPRRPKRALSAIKNDVWIQIKSLRDRHQFEGGIRVDNYWFKSDSRARDEYANLYALSVSRPPDTLLRAAWRTMTPGVAVDMTADLIRKIMAAGAEQYAAIDDAAQFHKGKIEAMTTSEDVLAYDYSTGWPAVYANSIL